MTSNTVVAAAPISVSAVPHELCALSEGVVLAGLLSGEVQALSVSANCTRSSIRAGKASVRALVASNDKRAVAALSSGEVAVIDVNEERIVRTWQAANACAPTALCGFGSDVGYVGDEAGGVLHIDARLKQPMANALEHGDYISALARTGNHSLLAASGDGTLGVYDARVVRLRRVTQAFDDDLTCLAIADDCAIAGTLQGALHAFDMSQLRAPFVDEEEDHNAELRVNRFRGHPDSINALAVRADLVITACADGLLRVVAPTDGSLLGVLPYDRSWAHDDDSEHEVRGKRARDVRWPIETMAVVCDAKGGEMLALGGHDKCVRFASLSLLDDSNEDSGEEGRAKLEAEPDEAREKKRKRNKNAKRVKQYKEEQEEDKFFGDL